MEKEAAAARGDGRPPTITEQQRQQRVATATEHTATGELPDPTHEGATITDTPQTTGLDPGDGAKTGECRPNITDAPRTRTPASQTSRGRSTSRSRCSRRQLTQLLKEGSECFNPDEVRRIVQAARAGPEGRRSAVHACLPKRQQQGAEGALPQHPAHIRGVNAGMGGKELRGVGLRWHRFRG